MHSLFSKGISSRTEKISRGKILSLLLWLSALSSWPASLRGQTDSIIPCKKKQVSSCKKVLAFSQTLNFSFFFVLALTRTLTRTCAHRRSLAHPRSLERSQTFCLSLSYSLRLGLELSQARTRAIEAHLSLSTLLPQPLLSTNEPRDDLPKTPTKKGALTHPTVELNSSNRNCLTRDAGESDGKTTAAQNLRTEDQKKAADASSPGKK